jgi:hypothetical protein
MDIPEEQKYEHTIGQIIIQLENLIMAKMCPRMRKLFKRWRMSG